MKQLQENEKEFILEVNRLAVDLKIPKAKLIIKKDELLDDELVIDLPVEDSISSIINGNYHMKPQLCRPTWKDLWQLCLNSKNADARGWIIPLIDVDDNKEGRWYIHNEYEGGDKEKLVSSTFHRYICCKLDQIAKIYWPTRYRREGDNIAVVNTMDDIKKNDIFHGYILIEGKMNYSNSRNGSSFKLDNAIDDASNHDMLVSILGENAVLFRESMIDILEIHERMKGK